VGLKDPTGGLLDGLPTIRPCGLEKILSQGKDRLCIASFTRRRSSPQKPARIDVVVVNADPNPKRPDLPHYGAGEPSCKPTIAAVANAIYDATGVRIRRVPFRDERVLATLEAAHEAS